MKWALDLASRARTQPNPRVGAVIVRNQRVVSHGFHRGPGFPHAEVEALEAARRKGIKNFSSYELFVNLEPCCHLNKRTPPCVPLLIREKFKRIIISHRDPNPEVSGRGIQRLRKAGLRVDVGLLEKEAIQTNQVFIKNQTQKLPYITLKVAMTFDGKMADDKGKSQWITGEKARHFVHTLRGSVDAIGVGRRTIDRDDPQLNIRLRSKNPRRTRVVIFGKPKKSLSRTRAAKANGISNMMMIPSKSNLRKVLKLLFIKHSICHLLIEGGPKLASQFLSKDLVDQGLFFYGKGLLGGSGLYSLGRTWGLRPLEKSTIFTPESSQILGSDVLIQGYFHVYRPHTKSRKSR